MNRKQKRNGLLLVSSSIFGLILILGLFGPFFLIDPTKQNLQGVLLPPLSPDHVLGTDALGRDIFSRLVSGARVSLLVSLVGMTGSIIFGTILGLTSGTRIKPLAWASDRLIDIQLAFPYVLLAIVIVAAVGPSIPILIVLMVLAGWPSVARVTRSIVLTERAKDYVKAAELSGASQVRILTKYIGPTIVPAVLVIAPLQASAMIVMEATLSFLGLGVQPPTPSWGGILLEGKPYLVEAWWLTTLPGITIAITCAALIGLGEGLTGIVRGNRQRQATGKKEFADMSQESSAEQSVSSEEAQP